MLCTRCLGDISGVAPSGDDDSEMREAFEDGTVIEPGIASLVLECAGGHLNLESGDVVGRGEKGQELFAGDQNSGKTISRRHAKVECENGRWFISDLNSSNGTYVNDARLNTDERRPLKSGDRVSFSTSSLEFIVK
ncbi:MAG: FHA domain-containing protein [Candidatus Wallbacteria bacterium]|nr:FHA domain-containing protein [Candidatus Wallbacteria bacterium]